MNREEYYNNKISYALSKIEFALEKLGHKKTGQKNPLMTLYHVLSNYENIDLGTLIRTTKMSRDDIAVMLRKLKEYGLADWEGTRLNGKKNIIALKPSEKPDFKEWYEDLMKRLKMTPEEKAEARKEMPQPVVYKDVVEIELDDGMTLTVTKDRLKKLILDGLKK